VFTETLQMSVTGERSSVLEAHHWRTPFSKLLDQFLVSIRNSIREECIRTSLILPRIYALSGTHSNGITLNRDCHKVAEALLRKGYDPVVALHQRGST